MGDAMTGTVAYREFCYRWTCTCGHENRVDAIKAGTSNECQKCNQVVKVTTVVCDNGAILKAW